MFEALLVALDLSPDSDRILDRATRLPLREDAQLTLVHVVPRMLMASARDHAVKDAGKALEAQARRVARKLPKRAVVRAVVKIGAAATEIARQARSVKAELIVMGRGGGRTLRDVFLGSTAERVIRHGQRPVLVVRQPVSTTYRRPMVALELDPVAHELLAWVRQMIPAPRPRIGWVHAYEVPFKSLIYPSLSVEQLDDYRDHARRQVHDRFARFLASGPANAEPLSWTAHVRHGSPRSVIQQAVIKARTDLLVLGTHGRTGAAHAFLGTVAGDVLREVPCDVLVVPPRD